MAISCVIRHYRSSRRLLPCVLALLLPISVQAGQTTPPVAPRPAPMVLVPPPPAVQFQQTAQQQQLRDRLQKDQLRQQLQQSVSDNAKRPLPADSPNRQQLDQADAARRDRNRAAQQDLLEHIQRADVPLPTPHLQPARASSGH